MNEYENEEMTKEEIIATVDELIRMGLVEEVWPEGSDVPFYQTIEKDNKKAHRRIDEFNDIKRGE